MQTPANPTNNELPGQGQPMEQAAQPTVQPASPAPAANPVQPPAQPVQTAPAHAQAVQPHIAAATVHDLVEEVGGIMHLCLKAAAPGQQETRYAWLPSMVSNVVKSYSFSNPWPHCHPQVPDDVNNPFNFALSNEPGLPLCLELSPQFKGIVGEARYRDDSFIMEPLEGDSMRLPHVPLPHEYHELLFGPGKPDYTDREKTALINHFIPLIGMASCPYNMLGGMVLVDTEAVLLNCYRFYLKMHAERQARADAVYTPEVLASDAPVKAAIERRRELQRQRREAREARAAERKAEREAKRAEREAKAANRKVSAEAYQEWLAKCTAKRERIEDIRAQIEQARITRDEEIEALQDEWRKAIGLLEQELRDVKGEPVGTVPGN